MPAILAVSTVSAAPACKDDDKTTTDAGSETSDSGTTAATTASTGATSTGTTTGTTMATGTGTDTDGVPDCRMIADKATCEATPLCVWPPELLQCTVDCMMITDEMVCGTQQFCAWIDGVCEMLII